MKILMLTPYLPYPPSSGGQIRSYNLIKQLSKIHEITLCSLIKFNDERKYIENLKPFCKEVYVFKRPEKPFALSNILRTGFSSLPLLVIRNFSKEEEKILPEIINKGNFDLIHAETFYVSPHIPKTKIPIVLVDQTIEYQVYEHFVKNFRIPTLRPLLYIDVFKIKFWEIYYWKKANRVVAVSEKDAEFMRKIVGERKVSMVPNGVGEDLMKDVALHFSRTILFMGNYAWLQNIEAARILALEVFPIIVKEIPQVKLILAGQFTEKIKELESESIVLKDLEVDDIRGVQNAYSNAGVLVAPLYGPGGTRLKILAAMAAKLPVVTTKVGIAGIGKDGQTYLEGNTSIDMAKGAIKLLKNKNLYEMIAKNGRKLVEDQFTYESISKKLTAIYQEVVDEVRN